MNDRNRIAGWLCIAGGLYPLALALGFWGGVESASAPAWILMACGLTFVTAGSMLLLDPASIYRDLGAAIIAGCFAAIGVWVSVFSPDEGFSGGLPFVSNETNLVLARVVFGIGSLISAAIAVYAMRRWLARSRG